MFHLFLAFAAGYILAVLFPNYRINAMIANMWTWIENYMQSHKNTDTSSPTTPTPTPVYSAPEAAPRPTTQRVDPPTGI